MIAMMLPSSWPMLELYSRVARHTGSADRCSTRFWPGRVLHGLGRIRGHRSRCRIRGIARGNALSQLSRWIPAAAGVSLILAGFWQLTPTKQACLRHCASPCCFWDTRTGQAFGVDFRVGLHHGLSAPRAVGADVDAMWFGRDERRRHGRRRGDHCRRKTLEARSTPFAHGWRRFHCGGFILLLRSI